MAVFCVLEGGIRSTTHDPGCWTAQICAVKYRYNLQQDQDFAYNKVQKIVLLLGNIY